MDVKGFIRQKKSLFSNSEDEEGSLTYSVSKYCLYIQSRGVKKSFFFFFLIEQKYSRTSNTIPTTGCYLQCSTVICLQQMHEHL